MTTSNNSGSAAKRVTNPYVRSNGWTAARRRLFIAALETTCNVTEACRAAGMNYSSAFRLRRRDAGFAAGWQRAIDDGYDRLEMLVLEHGGARVATEPDLAIDLPPFDFEKALQLLKLKRAEREGNPRGPRGGHPPRNAQPADTNAALLKAIVAAEKRLKKARAVAGA